MTPGTFKKVNIVLGLDEHKTFKSLAHREETSMASIATRLLRREIERLKKKHAKPSA